MTTPFTGAEAPSARQLLRSTVLAAIAALVVLFTLVLPMEYGVDPVRAGKALGLTEAGKAKVRAAKGEIARAAAERAADSASAASIRQK